MSVAQDNSNNFSLNNMYALVMWIGDEPTTSVVPWTEVEVVGKKTRAKWGPKYWPVQLLRQSEDKVWLESLSVIANGDVLWSRSADENSNLAKKRKIGSDYNDDEDSDDVDAVTQPRMSPHPLKVAEEKSTVTELDESDKEDDSSTGSDCSTEKKIDIKDESTQTKNQSEPFDDLPKVTPEIIEFMDYFVSLIKSQLPEEAKFGTPIGKATVITPRRRTELLPGTGIWIGLNELCDITKKLNKKPKEMVRRLMRVLIKKEDLKAMTPTGKGPHRAIPKHIFSAVETYVNKNVHPGLDLSRTEYTRCLTLMCNSLRHPKPTLAARGPPTTKICAKPLEVSESDSDSSVDDRKRTRAARKCAVSKSSKNESILSEEKK